MKKKILHVITNFSALGGAEIMLSRLIKFTNYDMDHNLVSLIGINEDLYKDVIGELQFKSSLNWNGFNTLSVVNKLRKIIIDLNPDYIQCWMYHANVIGSISLIGLNNRPNLYWGIHHSLNDINGESKSTKIAIYLSRFLSKNPNKIFYCARSSLKQHNDFGFYNKKSYFIPNGVSLNDFDFKYHENSELIVGFAGRFHKAKGYEYLFQVISILNKKPIRFKIAGKGANLNNPAISKYIEDYNIDISKIDFLDQISDMRGFYTSINLFLMTSITEGFPNVLVESMASGVPCVSTDVGDASYIISDNGFICPIGDSEKLAYCINKFLYMSAEEKENLSSKSRDHIKQNFSIEHICKEYMRNWR
ncbi:glycosyltransferase [Acinetobacter pseudolwoffii]|uniref:glycosyltransferase n=1 Tax=Acinetobacter pseudolwoffii TaxID=2053287 RepID=UPI0025753603|nr:glycosyltransferase [Acinetobacter pseudolwoffii]MDM1335775.1 glycosyltransferase [Acinetobacter pseudolwoffii]